ncbi:DUF2913 family protein [Vibrio tapetis subsp. quintayensis]|uniref:DUF2913 family protein n=1 Tax=Vibrio tapetis TaxID=52443 RepID=UPI0025B5AD66|nr:DUF2913 family protein [Vibrio tapetis]MDN3682999.1 DUF2913 family protein [Vibrio tapetis subsp. quintayensis]
MSQSKLLLEISTHALLHLEFKRLDKRLSSTEQNNLLVQFLKRASKDNRYKAARKTAKNWLLLGRKPNGNLESILTREQDRLRYTVATDLHCFVELIGSLEQKLKTKVQYSMAHKIDLKARYGKVLVCVVDEDLKGSFDEDGLMFSATQILFIGSEEHKDVFSEVIEKDGHFQTVVAYEDEEHLRVELLRM